MSLGKEIKQKREALNLTQEDLAEKLNVSRQAISKWEGDQALPQGANRVALAELLGLDIPGTKNLRPHRAVAVAGWVTAVVLAVCLAVSLILEPRPEVLPGASKDPEGIAGTANSGLISRIRFYDAKKDEIEPVALWYDASRIDSILLDFSCESPDTVQLFYTPGGTETIEQTELLLTKSVSDGERSLLLSGGALHREDLAGHVQFEATFGGKVVSSDVYNMIFDPTLGG